MSAWMCTDRHIAFLAKAAEVHGLVADAGDLAVKMKAENVNSLMACYPDDWWELTGFGGPDSGDTLTIKVEANITDLFGRIEQPVWVLKVLNCYRYQACGHPEWDDSYVERITEALQCALLDGQDLTIVRNSLEYDAAPWGIG